jgi:hypothetical protein
MNKYLLLRDNKQSGPYTVPEIVEIGIKPYDLVWLEGKSAAWRYPSEIEELKAYSPTVEEQPFDRFYKTREAILTYNPPPAKPVHSAYEPKVAETIASEEIPAKKVYINFPVGGNEKKIAKPAIAVKDITTPAVVTPVPEPLTTFSNSPAFPDHTDKLPVQRNKPAEKKYFVYAAAAACIVLVAIVTLLFINNNSQKARLQELNTIVKQIQDRNANNVSVQATQVKHVEPNPVPPVEQTAETIINPELLKENDYNTPASSSTKAKDPVTTPAAAGNKPERVIVSDNSGVVYKERPVSRRSDSDAVPASSNENTPAATENIFKLVDITPSKYKVGMLGGISNLQLELTNNSNRELHKVVIEIKYLGPEKKVVNTQTVYFENVSAGAHSTIEVPRSKRGVSISYIVTDIKS